MNISYLNDLKCKQTDLVKTLKWGDFRAQREFFSGLRRVACIPQKKSLKSQEVNVPHVFVNPGKWLILIESQSA